MFAPNELENLYIYPGPYLRRIYTPNSNDEDKVDDDGPASFQRVPLLPLLTLRPRLD